LPAIIFAWAFEMTPEGVKRETEIDRSESITAQTGKKLNLVTIMMVIAAVSFVVVERYLPQRAAPGPQADSQPAAIPTPAQNAAEAPLPADDRSIAVLPFANRSNQDDDLFFTDGIHDDLLTQLAKIHDLNVISRTSVMEYRDTRKNLKEIGAELNVGTILEGGIQKVGNRVRINAQLIEVATDQHLWAETFDRELTAENIFDIQSEIARKIVEAVAVELTPEEEQRLSDVPTRNLLAYESYLRARELMNNVNYAISLEAEARLLLEKAIALDPEYAQAYALLADSYGQTYWRGIDTSDALLDKYRQTIDRALELDPDSLAALGAAANYHYRVLNDYRTSMELLVRALEQAPGDTELLVDMALCQRRLGLWQESIATLRSALKADPANRYFLSLMTETMISAGEYESILDSTVPLEDARVNELDIQLDRALAMLSLTGDLQPLQQVFEAMNRVDSTSYIFLSARVHFLQRNADRTIEVLNDPIWTMDSDSQLRPIVRHYQLANAYRLKGDAAMASQHFEQATTFLPKVMGSSLQPRSYGGMTIALALARLGRTDEAKALAARLVDDVPPGKDAMVRGWLLGSQAMVLGLAGDKDAAIDQLGIALQTPSTFRLTVWDLHYDPNWDFMRDDPRFVELATPPTVIRSINP
jgi:TolB-like protein/Tfp pilus assembly protein PilF